MQYKVLIGPAKRKGLLPEVPGWEPGDKRSIIIEMFFEREKY